ncbi:hypothetical protein FJY71_07080, partial [candidate division WOR-3 bacterium]|nr:hypothetical protein [candidate division WOR-3 bacterium]
SLSWEARAGLEFLLPTQTRLTAGVNYESPEASAQGTDAGHLRSDAAIRQAFLNRQLVVTLQVRDLFGTGAFESTSRGDDFYNYFRFAHQSPMVSLNLVWNFNNYRPDRRQREPMDDESGGNETEGGF